MNTMSDTYTTPEGFELYKPLLLPDVRRFEEILTADRVWDFNTMNHKNGYPQAETPKDIRLPGLERVVSRFCSVRNFPERYHMMVTPSDALLEVFTGDRFAFFDRVGLELIYHESNNRVLVVASASQIIASAWVAYIDPESVPTVAELEGAEL